MSEEQKQEENQEEQQELSIGDLKKTLEEKDAKMQELEKQLNSVKSKSDELLHETKKAKDKARAEQQAAEQAALEKAKKDGDYEQLLKSSEQQRQEIEKQYKELLTNVASEKTRNQAMKVANELADGHNAELLSEFVARRLKYTDEGIKVLDEKGELTVSKISDLKKEFETSEKYKALLRGSKASGGSAAGAGVGDSEKPIMQRADFDKLNPTQKSEFIKKGGKLTD